MDIHTEQFNKIVSLFVNKAPPEQILDEIKDLKEKITKSIKELQRMPALLDGLAEQYDVHPVTHEQKWTSLKPSTFVSSDPKKRIAEIATRLAVDGIINTQDIIPELRSLGDEKPDKTQLIRIGNILHQRGWEKIGTGKYIKAGTQPKMEVK